MGFVNMAVLIDEVAGNGGTEELDGCYMELLCDDVSRVLDRVCCNNTIFLLGIAKPVINALVFTMLHTHGN